MFIRLQLELCSAKGKNYRVQQGISGLPATDVGRATREIFICSGVLSYIPLETYE